MEPQPCHSITVCWERERDRERERQKKEHCGTGNKHMQVMKWYATFTVQLDHQKSVALIWTLKLTKWIFSHQNLKMNYHTWILHARNLTLLTRDCRQRLKKSNFRSFSCTKWTRSIQESKCDFQAGTGIKINHEILTGISTILKTTTF